MPTAPADSELRPYLRPPQPCARAGGYPAVGLRRADQAISILYPVAETRPTVLLEDLGVYRATGRVVTSGTCGAAVARGGCADATGEWTLLEYGVAGRGSLLIRLREQIEDYDGNLSPAARTSSWPRSDPPSWSWPTRLGDRWRARGDRP